MSADKVRVYSGRSFEETPEARQIFRGQPRGLHEFLRRPVAVLGIVDMPQGTPPYLLVQIIGRAQVEVWQFYENGEQLAFLIDHDWTSSFGDFTPHVARAWALGLLLASGAPIEIVRG